MGVFEYDPRLFEACASSSIIDDQEECCEELYDTYLSHYYRTTTTTATAAADNTTSSGSSSSRRRGSSMDNSQPAERWTRFRQTVQRVFAHNTHNLNPKFRLTVNRFADRPATSENSNSNSNKSTRGEEDAWSELLEGLWSNDGGNVAPRRRLGRSSSTTRDRRLITRLDSAEDIRRVGVQGKNGGVPRESGDFSFFHTPSNDGDAPPSSRTTNKKKKKRHKKSHHRTARSSMLLPSGPVPPKIKIGSTIAAQEAQYPFGGSFQLDSADRGVEVRLKTKRSFDYFHHGRTGKGTDEEDAFATSINWATEENPDGVPLVHKVFDQGTCGSCWAYAATGSLETSAARRVAQDAYWEAIQNTSITSTIVYPPPPTTTTSTTTSNTSGNETRKRMTTTAVPSDSDSDIPTPTTTTTTTTTMPSDLVLNQPQDPHQAALEYARRVEAATFRHTRLSIQELLDCDTAADQGCTGGNPLLAFFYIHRYGLTSWDDYPYTGSRSTQADACAISSSWSSSSSASSPWSPNSNTNTNANEENEEKDGWRWRKAPIATVDSWGILPKNHEDLIALTIRFIGPVAVGINGADPSFVDYGGGIFEDPYHACDQPPNHALLIVGYGEQEEEEWIPSGGGGGGEVVRYWIARNSWGSDWGEEGYIRIRRGPGGKKIPGVCGIARSPSVALGGRAISWSASSTTDDKEDDHHHRHDFSLLFGNDDAATSMDDDGSTWLDVCDKVAPSPTLVHIVCHNVVGRMQAHRAATLGGIGLIMALLLAWVLSYPCRLRREQRRKWRRQRQRSQPPPPPPPPHSTTNGSESTPLLVSSSSNGDEYGGVGIPNGGAS